MSAISQGMGRAGAENRKLDDQLISGAGGKRMPPTTAGQADECTSPDEYEFVAAASPALEDAVHSTIRFRDYPGWGVEGI